MLRQWAPFFLAAIVSVSSSVPSTSSTENGDVWSEERINRMEELLQAKYGPQLVMWRGRRAVRHSSESAPTFNIRQRRSACYNCDAAQQGNNTFGGVATDIQFSYSLDPNGCQQLSVTCAGYGSVFIVVELPIDPQGVINFAEGTNDTLSVVTATMACEQYGWGANDPNIQVINNEFTCQVTIPVPPTTTTTTTTTTQQPITTTTTTEASTTSSTSTSTTPTTTSTTLSTSTSTATAKASSSSTSTGTPTTTSTSTTSSSPTSSTPTTSSTPSPTPSSTIPPTTSTSPLPSTSVASTSAACTGSWSAWITEAGGTCNDTCGNCGAVAQYRTCIPAGCQCSGISTANSPCNEVVCTFPRPPCCAPYTKKITGGKFICV